MSSFEAPPIEPYLPPINFVLSQSSDNTGTLCETRQYERVTNSKGEKIVLRSGAPRPRLTRGIQDEWSAKSALVVIKEIDSSGCPHTELEIQSPYMKAALKSCIPQYASMDIEQKSIILHNEPRCVFHFRQELMNYHHDRMQADDRQAALHVKYLLDYMFNILSSEIRHFTQHMNNPLLQPSLEFSNLWMAFVPGDIIFVKGGVHHTMREESWGHRGHLLRLSEMNRSPSWKQTWPEGGRWEVVGYKIDYDQPDFGHCRDEIHIARYEGTKALQDLEVVPLQYHPNHETIRARFIERGKMFVNFRGRHYQQYKGVARLLSGGSLANMTEEEDTSKSCPIHVNGRIIIDYEGFLAARPTRQPYFHRTEKTFAANLGQHLAMSDNEFMICDGFVAGFALKEKKWGWFEVDLIQDVEFDESSFDSLILQGGIKEILYALVKSHKSRDSEFDDVIKGKGKGLIFLLHGEPGTGKTLTAESIAEDLKMPIIRMNAARLGSSMAEIEGNLTATFELAEKWGAIALLDEADVFLEQRGRLDLERNRLVAAFLRAIEYFGGILFLTTNRVESFDRAFISRIHLTLHYPMLDSDSRNKIWKTFLSRPGCEVEAELLRGDSLDDLAREGLNGREIRNAVHIANALASGQGRLINKEDLSQALSAMRKFQPRLGESRGDDEGEPAGTSAKRAAKRRRVSEEL
ncbi:P-loop containing nucleoside triphosphate hydrolase protein [Nemania abortiva]|nr:P-loop containing nucleoside triphosphate hydrolase protein [Nemania abortiva]